ncbi:ATP-binding protein [Pseudomonas typographi]|uniref:ATP-binding protein n=1 Tax=Pseudomonas typographi TaxID=2715964 RepID=UPI001687F144|nr:ATP-binding protein [Pseudomonas typographi]MBD1586294.1 response regulator [Pseudomonas typographi]
MSRCHYWGRIVWACAWLLLPWSASAAIFTEAEQAWMAQHPVVRYAIRPNWPVEYVVNGEHRGLTRAYIDRIASITGLRFELAPSASWHETVRRLRSGDLDLVPAVSVRLASDRVLDQMLLSDPFFVGASVIIGRDDSPLMFSPQKLKGKVVAIRRSGGYEHYLREVCADITLLQFDRSDQALNAVANGEAFAAVGLDLVLQPAMRRDYPETLRIAGILADMPVVLSMGVAPGNPTLQHIVDKALAQLSSMDRNAIEARWVDTGNLGKPTLAAIAYHRWPEAAGLLGVLLLLAWLARRARLAQRVAQASEKAKSSFLAVMSHEIRTPMNAVQASLELLRRTPLNDSQRNLLNLANDSSSALLELLDDVLDVSRLDARKLQLDEQPTHVVRLLESVADIHRLQAQTKAVSLVLDSQGLSAQPVMWVDPVRLRQVLSNLLSNAVKFTEHGVIDVQAQLRPGPELYVSVRDSGIGITAGQQTKLFQAFSQASQATVREYGGSGLGLAICKQLLELMGGSIAVRSQWGQGSTFSFSLPVRLADAAEATVAPGCEAEANHASGAAGTVLVIEDHPINRQALALQLNALGYAYVMVADGHQGLARLQAGEAYAALLLDCYLPQIDGYEVARRIRQLEAQRGWRRLPIIAISAATDERHRTRALEAGMDAILTKPLRLAQLTEQLAHWLPAADEPAPAPAKPSLQAMFVTACEADLAGLRQALAGSDWPKVRHHAHRILGAALVVKVQPVADCAAQIEACASAEPPKAPGEALLGALEHALRQCRSST